MANCTWMKNISRCHFDVASNYPSKRTECTEFGTNVEFFIEYGSHFCSVVIEKASQKEEETPVRTNATTTKASARTASERSDSATTATTATTASTETFTNKTTAAETESAATERQTASKTATAEQAAEPAKESGHKYQYQ